MKNSSLFMAVLLGSLSMSALAQQGMGGTDGGERKTKTFTELDRNSDGILEQNEVSGDDLEGDFDQLDADGDREVNRNEYYQYYRDQGAQR